MISTREPKKILLVDDDPAQRGLIGDFLEGQGFRCCQANSAEQALHLLKNQSIQMIIMDVRMGGMSGLEALREVRKTHSLLPVLLITAYGYVRDAITAIKDGALDYLVKPIELEELKRTVEETLGNPETMREPPPLEIPRGVVAHSPTFLSLLSEAKLVAPSRASVLITGESGSGKDVVADLLHSWSDRRDKPFIKVNCAALPDNLLESELFGHEKGAFTGAVQAHKGHFKAAQGGTLLLDEIGEMSPALQAKLLRVLQDGSFQSLGNSTTQKVDVRILAATNVDVEKALSEGHLREDLFYRLSVIHLSIPPLRKRPQDILPLAHHFARTFSGGKVRFSAPAEKALQFYGWPGNIRELHNLVERACLLSRGGIILLDHFPSRVHPQGLSREIPEKPSEGSLMEELERTAILTVLSETEGNKTLAAKRLGISRRELLYKIQEYREKGYL